MCIICVKPSGIAMPSSEVIKTCWQSNPDGAGIAYSRLSLDNVVINKGFMKLKSLNKALDALDFTIDDQVILHFRIGTHGLIDAGNCHPFPLSKSIDELRSIQWQGNTAIAHNGIFGSMTAHETLSDTQKFIRRIMCNDAIINNIDNDAVQELISGYCGTSSKLAILRPGKINLIGNFIKDNTSGLYFSNSGYKPFTPLYYKGNDVYTYSPNKDYFPLNDNLKDDVCLLCEKTSSVRYRYQEEAFLCDTCFDFSLSNNHGCCD